MKIEKGTSNILYTFNEYELKQHDKQIRQEERQKVIEELEKWVDTCYLVESVYEDVYCIDKDDLKQKLKEMKEGK